MLARGKQGLSGPPGRGVFARSSLGRLVGFLLSLRHGPDLVRVGNVVNEEDAVTVVEFVLEDARQQAFRLDAHRLPTRVESLDSDGTMARDVANPTRYRQAPLDSFLHFTGSARQFWVDDGVQSTIFRVLFVFR